jgi:hypothetical protein
MYGGSSKTVRFVVGSIVDFNRLGTSLAMIAPVFLGTGNHRPIAHPGFSHLLLFLSWPDAPPTVKKIGEG